MSSGTAVNTAGNRNLGMITTLDDVSVDFEHASVTMRFSPVALVSFHISKMCCVVR